MLTAYILRGLSGSGKTHFTKLMKSDIVLCSLDSFFTDEQGNYKFVPERISEAAATCMENFLRALKERKNVCVDNTNTRHWEYEQYVLAAELAGYDVEILEFPCRGLEDLRLFAKRNSHGTPLHVLGAQFARWEDDKRASRVAVD